VIDAKVAEAEAHNAGELYEVWPDNVRPLRLFLALRRHWRVLAGGMGGMAWIGLDYVAVESVLRLMGTPRRLWRRLFADLRAMEDAALPILNEKSREASQSKEGA
jgi:hypothetical protein